MKTIRIEFPNYEGREADLNTIAYIATKHDLDYDAFAFPLMTIYDDETNEIIMESDGIKICYVNGKDSDMEEFLKEIKKWVFD